MSCNLLRNADHSPVQLFQPDITTATCVNLQTATVTRRAVLQETNESGRVVASAAFPRSALLGPSPRRRLRTRVRPLNARLRSSKLNQRMRLASVLWSSCLAMLAVGANGTAIIAALPTMQTELFLSSAGVQWAVNAYLVVSAACIVLGGQAADRFGARLASMVGLALFGVASCIIAASGTQAELLAGRALQGLAAAFAVPSTLAAVNSTAAPERRGAAIGAWSGFVMLGFSIGPLLGGALTHVTS